MALEEKVYTIPLREAYKKARIKRTPYAARLVRSYIKIHAKVATVKIGSRLNASLWKRSTKKTPHKIRVKVVTDGDVAKAELVGFEYTDFKAQPKSEKKGIKERLAERLGPKAQKQEELEKKIEGKEEKQVEKAESKDEKVEEKTKADKNK